MAPVPPIPPLPVGGLPRSQAALRPPSVFTDAKKPHWCIHALAVLALLALVVTVGYYGVVGYGAWVAQ